MKKLFSSSRLILLILPFLFILIYTCTQPPAKVVERGNDPWVMRSVLDKKPRMISFALSPQFWVAYDTYHCSLYKIWKDGISFDGPVYNYRHGPQPTSMGAPYTESTIQEPWKVSQNGQVVKPKVSYKGHKIKQSQAMILYDIILPDGTPVSVTEQPEYVQSEGGKPGLERTFTVSGLPNGTDLELEVYLASVPSESSITATGGTFILQDKKLMEHPVIKAYEYTGLLKLNPEGKTIFTVFFNQDPIELPKEEGEEAPSLAPGLALIEQSDCKTCHNEKSATVGPSYEEIAQKYTNNARTVKSLASKVIQGGTGVWGEQLMTPHPDVTPEDANTMVAWILDLDKSDSKKDSDPFYDTPSLNLKGYGINPDEGDKGVVLNFFVPGGELSDMSTVKSTDPAAFSGVYPAIHFSNREALAPFTEQFAVKATGFLNIPVAGKYDFATVSDDGSWLYIDGKQVVDNGGFHGADWRMGEMELTAGPHPFTYDFFQGAGGAGFSLMWMQPNEENFSVIPPEAFTYRKEDLQESLPIEELLGGTIPGDGSPLEGVHPSFDLSYARPDDFEPMVGGLDFLSDGRLVVSTWDANGAVYLLDGVEKGDGAKVTVKRIAFGLAEPLGIKVVDNEIYVLQKQELTRLVDTNGDDIIDEYQTVCSGWKVSANFHEFAFGLVYKDGYFYATLATAIEPGGKSTQPQIPDRGKVVKISKENGSFEFIAHGLRTPNGIGLGTDNEIFVADNQGDWLPSSKIVHVRPGAFFGSRSVDFEGTANLKESPPVVWLPQDEIGNSPSQPARIDVGPYKGQMIHGEVTHGGIKRVFVEKVNGEYQGALFRFTQGLEGGVNRIVWGPDGALYAGCIGNPGNWGHYGRNWYGLQRLAFNEKSTFEMLAVRARTDGMEIEFTEPLAMGYGLDADDYEVRQWYYKPTVDYGGPKIDDRPLRIRSVNMSTGRRRVFLQVDGMKPGHVVYIRLKGSFVSEKNQDLWNTECWYTLNNIPANGRGFANEVEKPKGDNMLTEAEKDAGWMLLFDGKTTKGWRGYQKETVGSAWNARNGALTLNGPQKDGHFVDGGYILTDQPYENYELALEWNIAPGGNSGIIYNVVEMEGVGNPWETGPEMQVLDNARHPDAKFRTHRAGDLYDMIECKFVTVKPAGEWNSVRLIVNKGKVQHWQNGYKVVEYDMNDASWPEMIAKSKFKDMPHFGKSQSGHICLQDHDNVVSFRNIKIRLLDKETLAIPISLRDIR